MQYRNGANMKKISDIEAALILYVNASEDSNAILYSTKYIILLKSTRVPATFYESLSKKGYHWNLLSLKHPLGFWWHTIDTPVGVAMFVTYCDWKPAIVSSNDLDDFISLTGNCHFFTLTSVSSFVAQPISTLTWKQKVWM